ncbi:MAG: hypothetical protein DSM106950_36700 [Stigonema ocellatum SAG 48.90 = DSM 106950]|nr:hypothetical protein [Stigonema ocellatum SAG 48.90 = DSM 106950]
MKIITRTILDQYRQAHPERELFSYVRSGYSGSAGFEAGNFPGDETADFSRSSGLASLTTDMLNRGIGGAYGFTTDIGGYLNYPNRTDKELYLRWTAWSALTPFFRVHNSGLSSTVMPYDFDNDTLDSFAKLAALHQQAIPLIKRLWQEARTTGIPITRPLWLVYPNDTQAAAQDQEWLLGEDVLVAPVVSQGKTSREVYIPAGCWHEQNTAVNYHGPKTIMVDSPVGTLPYFFRCGTNPFIERSKERTR